MIGADILVTLMRWGLRRVLLSEATGLVPMSKLKRCRSGTEVQKGVCMEGMRNSGCSTGLLFVPRVDPLLPSMVLVLSVDSFFDVFLVVLVAVWTGIDGAANICCFGKASGVVSCFPFAVYASCARYSCCEGVRL